MHSEIINLPVRQGAELRPCMFGRASALRGGRQRECARTCCCWGPVSAPHAIKGKGVGNYHIIRTHIYSVHRAVKATVCVCVCVCVGRWCAHKQRQSDKCVRPAAVYVRACKSSPSLPHLIYLRYLNDAMCCPSRVFTRLAHALASALIVMLPT